MMGMPMLLAAAVLNAAPSLTTPPGFLRGSRALICAAAAEGDAKLVDSIAKLAVRSNPDAAPEIAALEEAIGATGKCPEQAPPATTPQPVPSPESTAAKEAPIKGSLEFGLGQTSGSSDSANANIAATLQSDASGWKQRLAATLDYQNFEGVAASERYTASYALRRDLSKTVFVSALVSFESDRLAGFEARTAQSVSFGAKLDVAPTLTLDLSGGPSLRQIDWVGSRDDEKLLGARGTAALGWAITPGINLAASSSAIFEAQSGTIEGQASITGKLIGPLATRLQFQARHETQAYPGIPPTSTSSRASIVYSF